MSSYSVAEAKNNLPKLLDRALAGEKVTITRRGRAIPEIVAKPSRAAPLDPEWLEKNIVIPKSGSDFDSALLIRRMRDEGY